MDRRAIGTLSVGHGGVDFASGAIPSLIPFLGLKKFLEERRD